jgi:hypothetical protein
MLAARCGSPVEGVRYAKPSGDEATVDWFNSLALVVFMMRPR